MAGNETSANRPIIPHPGALAPTTAARARATRLDSAATRTGSWPADRTADRCVVVCWYSATSSSISAPESRRRRLTRSSSRRHAASWAAVKTAGATGQASPPAGHRIKELQVRPGAPRRRRMSVSILGVSLGPGVIDAWPKQEAGTTVAEVVTGEAVVLEVPCARFPSRLLALALDLLIQGILLFA